MVTESNNPVKEFVTSEINGVTHYSEEHVIRLIKNACHLQRVNCANHGKHYKFGFYKYKKEDMINAPEPEFLVKAEERYKSAPAAKLTGMQLIEEERLRQINSEKFTYDHDDKYTEGQLADAAECYRSAALNPEPDISNWPWHLNWWKPTTGNRNLIKAGALFLAELERLERLLAIPDNQHSGITDRIAKMKIRVEGMATLYDQVNK